jgi:hypothetical protein
MPKSTAPQAESSNIEPMVKIILAEADAGEVAKIKSQIDVRLHQCLRVARNCTQLIDRVSIESPDLVILSRIDTTDFADVCRKCRRNRSDLPIFLLSKTPIISDSFRNLVKTVGISDVIPQTASDLDRLLNPYLPIDLPIESKRSSIFTCNIIAAILTEIIGFCRGHFGDLAQGNYWRKTHELLIDNYPSLRHWSVDRFAKVEVDPLTADREITKREIQHVRTWVQAFLTECERNIPDFRALIDRAELSSIARYLLRDPEPD